MASTSPHVSLPDHPAPSIPKVEILCKVGRISSNVMSRHLVYRSLSTNEAAMLKLVYKGQNRGHDAPANTGLLT